MTTPAIVLIGAEHPDELLDVPDAGHFPWLERPGCVRDALARFTTGPRLSR